jgi:hypothetical protein
MKFLTNFIFTLLMTSVFAAEDKSNLSVTLHSKNFVDSQSENPVNIDHSHMDIRYSKNKLSLEEFLQKTDEVPQGEVFWEFNVRTTLVPTLLKSQVSGHVLQKIDHVIADKKNEGFAQIAAAEKNYQAQIDAGAQKARSEIPQMVDSLLPQIAAQKAASGDPRLSQALFVLSHQSSFTPAQIQAATEGVELAKNQIGQTIESTISEEVSKNEKLLKQTIAAAKSDALEKLAEAREAARQEIKRRLNDLQLETSIQEVAIRVGRKVSKNTVVYFQIGKTSIDGAFIADDDRRTFIENLKPNSDLTTRLLSPSSTFAVGGGFVKVYHRENKKSWALRGDLAAYHYRLPFVNGNQFISDFLNLSDQDYRDHKDLFNLNTGFGRLLFDFGRFAYFVSGSVGEHNSFGTGFDWQFTSSNHLIVSFYSGNHKMARQSFSIYMTHDFTQKFTAYCGYNKALKMQGGERSDWGQYHRGELVLGGRYHMGHMPVPGNFANEPKLDLFLEGYIANNKSLAASRSEDFKNSENGVRAGLSLDWDIIFKGPLERAQADLNDSEVKIQKLEKEISEMNLILNQGYKSSRWHRNKQILLTEKEKNNYLSKISSKVSEKQKLYLESHRLSLEVTRLKNLKAK